MKNVLSRKSALAAGILAVAMLSAPQAAFAENDCTHSRDVSGVLNITTVTYRSGAWRYIGSQLLHVHTYDRSVYHVLTKTTDNYYGLTTYCTA